jgi:hypothetical protein
MRKQAKRTLNCVKWIEEHKERRRVHLRIYYYRNRRLLNLLNTNPTDKDDIADEFIERRMKL